MISITKLFEFEAAHFLPDHEGICKNIHGHSYKLEITVCHPNGEVDMIGRVVDFSLLKKFVQERVISILDHSLLNDIQIDKENMKSPTVENLLLWILGQLNKEPYLGYLLKRIKLYETSTSFAEWEGNYVHI